MAIDIIAKLIESYRLRLAKEEADQEKYVEYSIGWISAKARARLLRDQLKELEEMEP